MEIDEKAYWQRLKDLSVQKNKTLKQCCADLGFKYQSILNMHQRGTFPPVKKLIQIAAYYGTTVEFLVSGSAVSS